jgi:PAS domain-containing protein
MVTESPLIFFCLLLALSLALSTLLALFLYRYLKERKEAQYTKGWLDVERQWGRMVRLKAGAVLGALDDPVLIIDPDGWIVGKNQKAVEICFGESRRKVHVSEVLEDGWKKMAQERTNIRVDEDAVDMDSANTASASATLHGCQSATALNNINDPTFSGEVPVQAHWHSMMPDVTNQWEAGWISKGSKNIMVRRHDGTWFEAEATFSAVEDDSSTGSVALNGEFPNQHQQQHQPHGSGHRNTSKHEGNNEHDDGFFGLVSDAGSGSGGGAHHQNQRHHRNASAGTGRSGMQFGEDSVGSPEAGGARMWVVIFRDVSERLAAARELKIAKEAAEKANQEKSDFLVSIFQLATLLCLMVKVFN